eukprot:5042166-Amphidinium_carterae.1
MPQLQERLGDFIAALARIGLAVNLSKCAWIHNDAFVAPGPTHLHVVLLPAGDHILFLGGHFEPRGSQDMDVHARLSAAGASW